MVNLQGYEVGEALGEGAFAICRLGHKQGEPDVKVAVKSLFRNHPQFDPEGITHEISVMKAVDHPRCIKLLEVREDDEAIHLVEELAGGGELFDRIIDCGQFSEKDAVHLVHQVFDGIQYLHTHGMIHRDLKPENLLMVGRDPGTPEYMMLKIIDFGLSAQRADARTEEEWNKMLREFKGTQDYLAPEVYGIAEGSQKNLKRYTAKVDVWSAGCIYYIMLCAAPPFWAEDGSMEGLVSKIKTGAFEFFSPEWDAISDDSKDFIRQCLQVDVTKRATAIDLMRHRIFSNDKLPTEPLGHAKELMVYKQALARQKMKGAVRSVQAVIRAGTLQRSDTGGHMIQRSASRTKSWESASEDPNNPVNKEAISMFQDIDALGDGNGHLDLFEIIMYMQKFYEHLFLKTDEESGMKVVDEERLKKFATLLRDSVDKDSDGLISQEEFVRGYCIWNMHLGNAETSSKLNLLAADVY